MSEISGANAQGALVEASAAGGEQRSVAVAVVHWNQPERCRRTIDSFLNQPIPVELLIVDNGSTAEAVAALQMHRPEVSVRMLDHNAGFGPAANVGFRYWLDKGQHEFIVLAPHDVLLEPDCLERMVAVLEPRPGIGLACADVGDGGTPRVHPSLGSFPAPASVKEGWEPADYPNGTLVMARRECLLDIGLFDERYFAYGEEIDLGLRAKAAGWGVGVIRGARVHNPSMSTRTAAVDYLYSRNTLLLVREHSGFYHAVVRFLVAVLAIIVGLLQPSSRPPIFSARGRLRGLVDYLRGHYGPPPRRYFEKPVRWGETGSEGAVGTDNLKIWGGSE